MAARTAKVFLSGSRGRLRKRTNPQTLWRGRRLGRRFHRAAGRLARAGRGFGCSSRRGRFSGSGGRSRRGGTFRRLSNLCLLFARRKKRGGAGQNADVFFHNVSLKADILLIACWEQGSFYGAEKFLREQILLKGRFVFEPMRFGNRAAGETPIADVDATDKGRLLFARFVEPEICEQFHIRKSHIRQGLSSGARVSG